MLTVFLLAELDASRRGLAYSAHAQCWNWPKRTGGGGFSWL